MKYMIEGQEVVLDISEVPVTGDEICLLDQDVNLADGCPWHNNGFVVAPILDKALFDNLYNGVTDLVLAGLRHAGCVMDADIFDLEQYHVHCTSSDVHLRVIEFLRQKAEIKNLPLDYSYLDEAISLLCDKSVSCNVINQPASGYFFIRIVRPFPHQDNNPPHKDAWLDHLRNAINLYFPLTGSDQKSSLSLVSGSHLWRESSIPRTRAGAEINGVKYSVPSVVLDEEVEVIEMIRPKVEVGEGLIFSPYLIHGGAVNLNADKTRVSLEMRFWRSPG